MTLPPAHINHVLLFFYKKGVGSLEAAKEIRQVYGKNAMSDYFAQVWFKRFDAGELDLTKKVSKPTLINPKQKPPNDIIYDLFFCMNRQEIEKCRLISKLFNEIAMQRWDLLPLYRFEEFGNQYAPQLLISTYINDKTKEFWFNRDELPKIRSLRDSIFADLTMSTKRYWKRNIVTEEMLEYIYGINKEPLKVNWLQFVNPSENMLRNSLTYIHPIKHLGYDFSTYKKFHEAWPLICNSQLAVNQVHICVKSIADYIDDENFDEGWQLSSFLNQLNQGNRCSLIFYAKRLDSEMIFDDFIGGTIEVFEQAKNPGNLIEYLRIWNIKIVEEEIEDFKQVLLEKGIILSVKEKPRSSFDLLFRRNNEDRDKKYFGTLKMEDWNLDLELDVHKKKQHGYTYSDGLEDYDEYEGLVCDVNIKISHDRKKCKYN